MKLLMPKATAVWLVENTALTFEQIAKFCDLHLLEVQAIADDDGATNLTALNPLTNSQLSKEEIKRCEEDANATLRLNQDRTVLPAAKGPKYTPLIKRQNKPNAIAWFVKHYPDIPLIKLCRLLGTTKTTIEAIRNRTHRYSKTIQAKHPVDVGICSQKDFDEITEGLGLMQQVK